MTLSEKITTLRRKNGWSQEELAERLDVSRQSVSKWEMGQSIPEVEKIVQMSDLFGISTDALIRDEIDLTDPFSSSQPNLEQTLETNTTKESDAEEQTGNLLSQTDVRVLLTNARRKNMLTAIGVALCILSPILLILEQIFAGIAVLFIFVAIAVGCFVIADHLWKNTPYSVYTKGDRISSDVAVYIRENAPAADRRFLICNLIGIILFILSPIPLLVFALKLDDALTDRQVEIGVAILLGIVAVGVLLVLSRGTEMMVWERFRAILDNRIPQSIREGEEPTEARKREKESQHPFEKLFWSVTTAIYLLLSFITMRWDRTWIIWPVAAVLFAAAETIVTYIYREK